MFLSGVGWEFSCTGAWLYNVLLQVLVCSSVFFNVHKLLPTSILILLWVPLLVLVQCVHELVQQSSQRVLISGGAVGFGGGIRFASNFQPDYSWPLQARTFSKTILDLYYIK